MARCNIHHDSLHRQPRLGTSLALLGFVGMERDRTSIAFRRLLHTSTTALLSIHRHIPNKIHQRRESQLLSLTTFLTVRYSTLFYPPWW